MDGLGGLAQKMLRSRYSTPRPADPITPLASQRGVMRQRDGEAALLCYAQPGTAEPEHTHGHDEECLMERGESGLSTM
jgi:hypothetical protein